MPIGDPTVQWAQLPLNWPKSGTKGAQVRAAQAGQACAGVGHAGRAGRRATAKQTLESVPWACSQTPPLGSRWVTKDRSPRSTRSLANVHDGVAQLAELGGVLHRLGEEVREIVVRVDVGYTSISKDSTMSRTK